MQIEVINILHYQIFVSTIPEKNVQKSYEKNRFKITASTCNNEFKLPEG